MNILPPCLCNKPQKSNWLKVQCSNCLGVLKDSQAINYSSQTSLHIVSTDAFSKSLIDYLTNSTKTTHKRSCTDKTQDSLNSSKIAEKAKIFSRNPSDSMLIHKANQLSAPAWIYNKKKELLRKEGVFQGHCNSVNSVTVANGKIWSAGHDYKILSWPVGFNEYFSIKTDGKPCDSYNKAHNRPISMIETLNFETLITGSLDKTVKM